MKILAQAIPGNTIAGFARAATAAGHSWIWWEERHTPAFDAFNEIQPDMLFYMTMTRAMQKCINLRDIPTVQGYFDNQFLFHLGVTRNDTRVFHNVKCDYLVDTHVFNQGDTHDALRCDIGIVCEPNKVGLKLCQEPLNIKILHETAWPTTQYLGTGTLFDKRDLYRSADIVVVDTLMEAIRVIACGHIPVSVNQEVSDVILSNDMSVPYYDDANELLDFHHNAILCNPDTGDELFNTMKQCLDGHSYDDALALILGSL